MDVGTALVTDGQTAEGVEPGEGALDRPAPAAQARAVGGLASGDAVADAALAQEAAVLVVVVAAVGDDQLGAVSRLSRATADARDAIQEGQQLGDVVTVTGGRGPGQR
jgi:hypothetical protein